MSIHTWGLSAIVLMLLKKDYILRRPSWISCHRKNAQHLQVGIHRISTQHILTDKKEQKNIIYVEKQGPVASSLDYTAFSVTGSCGS